MSKENEVSIIFFFMSSITRRVLLMCSLSYLKLKYYLGKINRMISLLVNIVTILELKNQDRIK
jgi:hypothetical protein